MIETNTDEALKFDILDLEDATAQIKDKRLIGVIVETKVGKLENWPKELQKIALRRLTRRGTEIFAGQICYDEETEKIEFEIVEEIPDYVPEQESSLVGTTFPDFCWLLSEGTTEQNVIQVDTPFREDAEFGDLTWLVPAKFCDDLVEMMHIVNNYFLEGNLYQAILYGPQFTNRRTK